MHCYTENNNALWSAMTYHQRCSIWNADVHPLVTANVYRFRNNTGMHFRSEQRILWNGVLDSWTTYRSNSQFHIHLASDVVGWIQWYNVRNDLHQLGTQSTKVLAAGRVVHAFLEWTILSVERRSLLVYDVLCVWAGHMTRHLHCNAYKQRLYIIGQMCNTESTIGVAKIENWMWPKMDEWNEWPIKHFWFYLYGFKIKGLCILKCL